MFLLVKVLLGHIQSGRYLTMPLWLYSLPLKKTPKALANNWFDLKSFFFPLAQLFKYSCIRNAINCFTWIRSTDFLDEVFIKAGYDGPSDRDQQVLVGALHEGVDPAALVRPSRLLQDAHALG